MNIYKILSPFIFAILLGVHTQSYAEAPPEVNGKAMASMADMLKNVMPAVVNITVLGELPSSALANELQQEQQQGGSSSSQGQNAGTPNPKFQGVGSGVIVDAGHGYIVTNAHVVSNAKIVTVTLNDGRRFNAKLIGSDKSSDVAVLQIDAKNLAAIPFANSDHLQVGDFVAAVGNPFGLHQTVTSGVISALHRSDLGIEGYENFIQTDAPINPGNSGGALVNLQGQLVGMNTALVGPIYGNVGIGFSIPSNMITGVMNQLIKYGKVQRGVLGVMVQDLTPALANAFNLSGIRGALITNITADSPAAKAGLQPKDVVTRVNNTVIISGPQLRNIVGLMPIGSEVSLEVHRGNQTMTIKSSIVSPKTLKLTAPEVNDFLGGVRLTNYDQLVPDLGHLKGVGVLDVDQTSQAWLDGLRPGDVILETNNQPVVNVTELVQATNTNKTRLLLKIARLNGIIYLVID